LTQAKQMKNPLSKELPKRGRPKTASNLSRPNRVVATFPQTAEINPDGTVMYRQRYWGSFSQPLELKTFPFDAQKLTLTLANVGFGMRSVRLLPSPKAD
jgi:hypothetical protein